MLKFLKFVANILFTGLISIIIPIFFYSYIAMPRLVQGESMYPYLYNNDIVVISRPWLKKVKKGEVVVYYHEDKVRNYKIEVIKRIVGLQGDKIEFKDNGLFVNNKRLSKYDGIKSGKSFNENTVYTVPKNNIMAIGDNFKDSIDCREYGFVNKNKISGVYIFKLLESK